GSLLVAPWASNIRQKREGKFCLDSERVTSGSVSSRPNFAKKHETTLARNSVTGRTEKPRGELPKGTRIYVIGDIHGRADLLDQVLEKIGLVCVTRPGTQSLEVFLGDYIDRGTNSKLVIEHLIQRSRSHRTIFLKGNHEAYLCEFLKSPE